jgi:hypothetical protein
MFRERGLRVLQLTHNRRNLVGDGCMEPGNAGLSNFGRQVVARAKAQKIVVDLAHGSQRTMREGIAASRAPTLSNHTGCRALADLPRNTDDATLRALAARGVVAGIIFWPYLRTDTQPMAEDVIRHIEHAGRSAAKTTSASVPIPASHRSSARRSANRRTANGSPTRSKTACSSAAARPISTPSSPISTPPTVPPPSPP